MKQLNQGGGGGAYYPCKSTSTLMPQNFKTENAITLKLGNFSYLSLRGLFPCCHGKQLVKSGSPVKN